MDTIICPKCGTANPADAVNCKQCRINLQFALQNPAEIERIKQEEARSAQVPQGLPKFDELRNYLWKSGGYGISRTVLIVGPFIGWIILGLPTLAVFSSLGKRGIGLAYLIPYNILGIVAGYILSDPWGDYIEALPWILLAVVGLYIAAWVHINVIRSRYQLAARQRIAEIEHRAETGIDSVLEKGLLHGVLQEKQTAIDVLSQALPMSDGDPYLLTLAGNVMSISRRPKEAVQFYDRALAIAKDEVLIKQIKNRLKFVRR
jgi:tetratricopeptide (TPR) repeat protein